jgi:hypothetical protein
LMTNLHNLHDGVILVRDLQLMHGRNENQSNMHLYTTTHHRRV